MLVWESWWTHSCDRLHTEYEWIRGQVSRIGEGVFFPELAEIVLFAWHARMIVGKISCALFSSFGFHHWLLDCILTLKEQMDDTSWLSHPSAR